MPDLDLPSRYFPGVSLRLPLDSSWQVIETGAETVPQPFTSHYVARSTDGVQLAIGEAKFDRDADWPGLLVETWRLSQNVRSAKIQPDQTRFQFLTADGTTARQGAIFCRGVSVWLVIGTFADDLLLNEVSLHAEALPERVETLAALAIPGWQGEISNRWRRAQENERLAIYLNGGDSDVSVGEIQIETLASPLNWEGEPARWVEALRLRQITVESAMKQLLTPQGEMEMLGLVRCEGKWGPNRVDLESYFFQAKGRALRVSLTSPGLQESPEWLAVNRYAFLTLLGTLRPAAVAAKPVVATFGSTKLVGPFESRDVAAATVLSLLNPASIQANEVYWGLLYRDADNQYFHTPPQTSAFWRPPLPTGMIGVGEYRTGGNYSTIDYKTGAAVRSGAADRDDFNSLDFAASGKANILRAAAAMPEYAGYLATPASKFLKYDSATGETFQATDWLSGNAFLEIRKAFHTLRQSQPNLMPVHCRLIEDAQGTAVVFWGPSAPIGIRRGAQEPLPSAEASMLMAGKISGALRGASMRFIETAAVELGRKLTIRLDEYFVAVAEEGMTLLVMFTGPAGQPGFEAAFDRRSGLMVRANFVR